MLADTAAMEGGRAVDTAPKQAASNLLELDGRTKLAKRIGELRGAFIEAPGGREALTPVVLTRIDRAAHLCACAQVARSHYLAGVGTMDDVVRAENVAA